MATIGEVKGMILEQLKVPDQCKERRAEWQKNTKGFIEKTLTQIVTDEKIGSLRVAVRKHPTCVWLEFMAVTLFTEMRNRVETGYAMIGGSFGYSLGATGHIFLWHTLPYVEDKQKPNPTKIQAVLEPKKLTEQLIVDHAAQFLSSLNSLASRPEPSDADGWDPRTHCSE
jgi:hypothetical protein